MELVKQIEQLIEGVIKDNACYIDDIEYVQEQGEWYLRIFIDLINGSLDMDTCVTVSEQISDLLDEADPIQGEYYLEVSSPGAEKPLKNLEQVKKHIGDYVYMKLSQPKAGFDELYGTLLDVQDDVLEIE